MKDEGLTQDMINDAIREMVDKGLPEDTMILITGELLNELLDTSEYNPSEIYEWCNGEINQIRDVEIEDENSSKS